MPNRLQNVPLIPRFAQDQADAGLVVGMTQQAVN